MEKIKVIIKDTCGEVTFVEMTAEQYKVMEWLDDKGLLNDVSYSKVDDAEWEIVD